ncbi:MAG: hypothetical protein E3J56_09800 [Candidatus Aminicenantes bacterium]|nr:MAG: hypothetical protein E3J56_09800 [Candidatus Aminicenantes bacterium]
MSVIPAKLVPAEAGSRNPVISHKYNLPPIIENLQNILLDVMLLKVLKSISGNMYCVSKISLDIKKNAKVRYQCPGPNDQIKVDKLVDSIYNVVQLDNNL